MIDSRVDRSATVSSQRCPVGFVNPDLPQVDVVEWRKGSRAERVRPMARHIAERGMGYPDVFYLLYLVKIGL